MKKYLASLLVVIVIVPQVVFAAWWNPISWFERIRTFFYQPKIENVENIQEKENISTSTTSSSDNQDANQAIKLQQKALEEERTKIEAQKAVLRIEQQQKEATRLAEEKENAAKKQAEILAQAAQVANQTIKTRTLELLADILAKENQYLTDFKQEIASMNANLNSIVYRTDSASQAFRKLTELRRNRLMETKSMMEEELINRQNEKTKFERNNLDSFSNFDPDAYFKNTFNLIASVKSQMDSDKSQYQDYFNKYLSAVSASSQIQQQQSSSANSTYCNGINYSSCPASYNFVCPAGGGAAYCQPVVPVVDTALLEKCQAIMDEPVSTSVIAGLLRNAGCPGY